MEQVNCLVCNSTAVYDFSSRDLMFNKHERYDYHRCTNCQLIFQHPTPSMAQISAFYPDSYDVYEEHSRLKKISAIKKSILKKQFGYADLKTTFLADLLELFIPKFFSSYHPKFVRNGLLLDVGSGNGRYLDGMRQLGWNVKGVEFNATAVDVCKLSKLDVHHGDLASASFKDRSFDLINVSHLIEHVPNPKELFVELSRVLKENGVLTMKTPNSAALGRKWLGANWFANEVPRHLFLFSEKNLTELGQSVGFEITQISTSTTPKIILNSIDYIIDNRGKSSKRIRWRRLLARLYVLLAQYKKQGDEIFVVFTKKS